MKINDWHDWCNEVATHLRRGQGIENKHSQALKNIQESLDSYHKLTKRMLLGLMVINTGLVILNGILLHYNGY